ncbi:hypothetical protein F5Y15DRAFT_52521 [Xylariaceae sp. FL0016]|nr:hypothetical protein F5Y15DRAFT_52521 [Xylariaceae sp. FL0016]
MSATKFEYSTYKLFEPQYHPERPIIIDADAAESPDTVTLRYEEEAAARASGGGLRGDSPPGLLSVSAYSKAQPPQMHAFESSRPYQDPQYQYSAQQFAAQQPENAAAQLNQMAFAANNTTSQYMTATPVVPTLLSYQPSGGLFGTKVLIKISAPYDLIGITSHFFLAFGSHKSPAHAVRDASDVSGLGYVVSGDAPQLEDTRSPSSNVPLSLMIETAEGQTLATMDVGTFSYQVVQAGAAESAHEPITRERSRSPEHQHQHQHQHQRPPSPKQDSDQLTDPATNTYGYAPTAAQQALASTYDAGYANNTNMLGTYHRSSYGADYPRPPLLKAPSWSHYTPSLTSPSSPTALRHTTISRNSITTLPIPNASAPQLIRTSTLQASGSSSGGQLNPYALYSAKAVLKINSDHLEAMASNWTQEEWENRRRIVMFNKKQQGSTLTTTFKPVTVSERPPNSICISCIFWAEKNECFVTSVDTISLLEQLVASPARFTVEEKNRIRRNLEGFKPLTVSKAKADSEEFFKIIMAFPNPKPRNIEKDVKVFPWKILAPALKKIISKYSASPSSQLPPGPSGALLTPVSSTSPGLYGPSHTPAVTDGAYSHHDAHTLASPRSLAGTTSSWGAYGGGRTLSPVGLKSHSPHTAGIRMPSLPSYGSADARQQHAYSLGPGPGTHHNTRWDAAAVSNGYADVSAAPAYASHHAHHAHHHHQSHVYASAGYGDGGHRE